MESNILPHQIHGISVGIQEADGYVNATKTCEAYRVATGKAKQPSDWERTKRAKELNAYVSAVRGIPRTELVITRKGGTPEHQGTWIHPDLAIGFGTWLSVEFEYELTQWVKEWEKNRHSQPAVIDVLKPQKPHPQDIAHVLDAVFGAVVEPARLAIAKSSAIVEVHPQWSDIMSQGLKALPSIAADEQTHTPTELGEMLEPKRSAIKINKLLEDAGYQESYRTARNSLKWRATAKGSDLAVVTLEAKANGKPIETLRWKRSIVDVLLSLITEVEQSKAA